MFFSGTICDNMLASSIIRNLVLIYLLTNSVISADPGGFQLPTISLNLLQNPTDAALSEMTEALSNVGLFAVTLDEAAASSTTTTLQEYTRCVAKGAELVRNELSTVILEDGSLRTSLATSTNHSAFDSISEAVTATCPSFAESAARLRTTVDLTGQAVSDVLDRLTADDKAPAGAKEEDSFSWVARNAESLEHFHLFTRSETREEGNAPAVALHMHSDIGLFIVMTPAQYIPLTQEGEVETASPPSSPGLFLELPDGRVVRPNIPQGALLVMGGEGAKQWVRRPLSVPWYAPGHEVVLPADMTNLARAWYGRMYLPARNALHVDNSQHPELTFNQFRTQTYQAFHQGKPETALALGCSGSGPRERRRLTAEGGCQAGEIECWHSCVAVVGCRADEAECVDQNTGVLWLGTHDCFACAPQCTSSPGDHDHEHHDHSQHGLHEDLGKDEDGYYLLANGLYKLKFTLVNNSLALDVMATIDGWVGVAWAENAFSMIPSEAVIGVVADGAGDVDTYVLTEKDTASILATKGTATFSVSETAVEKTGDWTRMRFTRHDYSLTGVQNVHIAFGNLVNNNIYYHGHQNRYFVSANFAEDEIQVSNLPSPPPSASSPDSPTAVPATGGGLGGKTAGVVSMLIFTSFFVTYFSIA